MSVAGVSALERGYRRTPQFETLTLLAAALALAEDDRRAFEAAAARGRSSRQRGQASITVGPWAGTGHAGLPLALTGFVGRESELAEIALLIRDHRLVTLTGSGGVGKTQTSLQVVATMAGTPESTVCFVGFGEITAPSLVAPAIASSLGVQELPSVPLIETIVATLRNRSLLLLLDGCEHVIEEAAAAAQAVLAGCPRVRILATSREPLAAAGERTYRLPSLSSQASVALFADRAQAVDAHFALDDANVRTVTEICLRLDGIPLAIELAAAHVNVLSVSTLAERLDDRFRILIGGERTALPRQQTMRATIDWSYDLLSGPERRVFERLSAFEGGCTLEAAVAVCTGDEVAASDVPDLLWSLVNKSLVAADLERSEPRYGMLESFRQYARERLAAREGR